MTLFERFVDWAQTVREVFGLFLMSSNTNAFATDEESANEAARKAGK